MKRDTRTHPHNSCIVNVQLDPHRARVFEEMRKVTGLTATEAMKAILNPAIDAYEKSLVDVKANQAMRIFGGAWKQD